MTIDIFVPTGEVRKVKGDEWFRDGGGTWSYWDEYCETSGVHPIGIRHQIEVPEGLDSMIYWFYVKGINNIKPSECVTIPLLRPKVKVKKWQFIYKHKGYYGMTCEYYKSIEELTAVSPNVTNIQKFEPSMIEVEE